MPHAACWYSCYACITAHNSKFLVVEVHSCVLSSFQQLPTIAFTTTRLVVTAGNSFKYHLPTAFL